MTGKFDRSALAEFVLARTGAASDDLLTGPAFGEDAAAIRVGEETLVASTDPISLAAERIGQLGVAVASNDVAAAGADPSFLLSTIFLPSPDTEMLDSVTAQLDSAARRLDICIAGGHTEVVAGLDRPLLSLACFGTAERFVSSAGATPGDRLLLTKGAAIEATGVLATDFRDDLDADAALLDRGAAFFEEVSVIPEAARLAPVATAMHDPTEGGVLGGLVELALASGVSLSVDRDAVPVRETTKRLCAAAGVDPLCVLGSGALLAAVPADAVEVVLDSLAEAGIDAAEIGGVESGPGGVTVGDERHEEPVRDEMYGLWE